MVPWEEGGPSAAGERGCSPQAKDACSTAFTVLSSSSPHRKTAALDSSSQAVAHWEAAAVNSCFSTTWVGCITLSEPLSHSHLQKRQLGQQRKGCCGTRCCCNLGQVACPNSARGMFARAVVWHCSQGCDCGSMEHGEGEGEGEGDGEGDGEGACLPALEAHTA